MKLWFKVRRLKVAVMTVIGIVGLVILVGDVVLPVPNLLSGTSLAVPIGLLAPLATAIVVAWGLTAGDVRLEAVASRPLHLFDTAYAVSIGMLTLTGCALAYPLVGSSLAFASGRNAIAYVGLMLIGRWLVGPLAAPLLPAGIALVTVLFGHGPTGVPRWWAWLLHGTGNLDSWSVTIFLLIAGSLVTAWGRGTVPSHQEEDW